MLILKDRVSNPNSGHGYEFLVLIGHFRVPFASVSKRVKVRNLSYENHFYSQVHSNANQTYSHLKGFELGLVLKQRQKVTWKWSVISELGNYSWWSWCGTSRVFSLVDDFHYSPHPSALHSTDFVKRN